MPSCCPGNKALSGKQWGDWCSPIGCLYVYVCLCVLEGQAAWQWGERRRQTTEEEEKKEEEDEEEERRSAAGRMSVGAQILTFRDLETV